MSNIKKIINLNKKYSKNKIELLLHPDFYKKRKKSLKIFLIIIPHYIELKNLI